MQSVGEVATETYSSVLCAGVVAVHIVVPKMTLGTQMQGRILGPPRFSEQEVGNLFKQLVTARGGQISDSEEAWAKSLYGDTEGHRGLTAIFLREVCLGLGVLPYCTICQECWPAAPSQG